MSTKKRSISAPVDLFALADQRAFDLGYRKFSAYVQKLIEDDVTKHPPHVRGEIAPARTAAYQLNDGPAAPLKAAPTVRRPYRINSEREIEAAAAAAAELVKQPRRRGSSAK